MKIVKLICWLALVTGGMPVSASETTLYINGKVLTANESFEVVEAFSVEANRFGILGSTEEVMARKSESDRVVDLGGRTVIPGLIDNHNHFIRGAQHWDTLVRLDGVKTRSQAVSMLKDEASTLAQGQWLLALGGWNEQQFVDKAHGFSRAELDEITSAPVFLQSQYSHAFVNSAFLSYFKIPISSSESEFGPDHPILGPPLAALVERDEEGKATGRINGGLMMVIQVGLRMPVVSPARAMTATRHAQTDYNAMGLTSVYDPAGGLTTDEMYHSVEALAESGDLTLRTFRTVWVQPRDDETVAQTLDLINATPPMLTGTDFYDTIGVGEALYMPLHDSAGEIPEITEEAREHVEALVGSMLKRGFPIQIHAVNEATIDFYLDVLESFNKQDPLKPGFVTITHAEGVTEQLLNRMAEIGVTVQVRSARVVNSRSSLVAELGDAALADPPLRVLAESEVIWGLGTDGTKAAQINPMITLSWAVTGRAINGDTILSREQRLTREEALVAHTRNNAALLFRADRLGQIAPNYLADFVVLNRDYLTVPETEIEDLKPVLTVVDGSVVYGNPLPEVP